MILERRLGGLAQTAREKGVGVHHIKVWLAADAAVGQKRETTRR